MSRRSGEIGKAFAAAAGEDRAALVVYVTAGHPEPAEGIAVLREVADAGTDVIELGVPFSDPLADGPTIQKSSFAAIEAGVDLKWTIDLLREFRRERPTPVVIFSYLNPILDYGVDRFIDDAVAAGADGVLLTDLPLGADPDLESRFEASALDLVRLIAPTTRPDRAHTIASRSQGFVYYVSRTGVTGTRDQLPPGLTSEIAALRNSSAVPMAVGFGISTPEQAATVAAVADGIVVGSAMVEAIGKRGARGAAELAGRLRGALVRGTPVG